MAETFLERMKREHSSEFLNSEWEKQTNTIAHIYVDRISKAIREYIGTYYHKGHVSGYVYETESGPRIIDENESEYRKNSPKLVVKDTIGYAGTSRQCIHIRYYSIVKVIERILPEEIRRLGINEFSLRFDDEKVEQERGTGKSVFIYINWKEKKKENILDTITDLYWDGGKFFGDSGFYEVLCYFKFKNNNHEIVVYTKNEPAGGNDVKVYISRVHREGKKKVLTELDADELERVLKVIEAKGSV